MRRPKRKTRAQKKAEGGKKPISKYERKRDEMNNRKPTEGDSNNEVS